MKWKCAGRIGLTVIAVPLAITALSAFFLRPLVARPGDNPRSVCQENLKNLAASFQMYISDYDAVLPSSILCMPNPTWRAKWDPDSFTFFASRRGVLPPDRTRPESWPMVLYPYLSDHGAIWCPSDRGKSDNPNTRVSYYWKAAVDAAWFGGPTGSGPALRKEGDFEFADDQIIFYERYGWHSRTHSRGLTDGVRINCAYLDGRVAQVEIRDSGYTRKENPAEPLPRSGMGQPAWFNYSFAEATPEFDRGQNWNPQVWGDNLREIKHRISRDEAISACQSNLKNLALGALMYVGDWDACLPSSALYANSQAWSPDDFTEFAGKRGTFSRHSGGTGTWPTILYPYLKYKRAIWCPSDPSASDDPNAVVSYYWKAAIDAAWFGGPDGVGPVFRKEGDFAFPADQIVLYERCSWHWNGPNRGLVNGVTINCAFMDGHVASKRIRDSGYSRRDRFPGPLPESGVGEPAWFNYSYGEPTPRFSRGPNWDPAIWADNLP